MSSEGKEGQDPLYLGVEGDTSNQLSPNPRRASSVYDTKYQNSLRHYLTREALPKEDHYRNLNSIVTGTRPTLDELHDPTLKAKKPVDGSGEDDDQPKKKLRGKVVKFGWLEGVFMRCLLNIWGVMLFLRVSWVVGEDGMILALTNMVLANIITSITAISMSAVATNGQIKAGGIYYMISRSLGPEFGGSIGLLFTLANSIAASTYIIGFVNSVQDMCSDYFDLDEIIPGAGGGLNDVRILGTISLILVLALAIVGMDWVTRVQVALLFLLIGSQIDFVVGAFMGPEDDEEEARGFVGFNADVFNENLKSDYRYLEGDQGFFSVFGVFFTAVTGIVAGANLSGDLKDPSSAIPKGTLGAIALTFVTYIIYPMLIGSSVVRDAAGNTTLYLAFKDNSSVYENPNFDYDVCGFDDDGVSYCDYGSQNSFQVMELMAAWGPLIYMGTFAATLSSAIASLVGAPRVLQALAKDRLYPYLHVFEVGWGANNDPVRGYVLVFILSFACIMVGELNAVSTLLTNCFLASYALINFSCFHASLIKSPGWRPSFKYYNLWGSFLGGVLCLITMFFIDWITALITYLATGILYYYVSYRKPDVNWGSSIQAQNYLSALKSTLELITIEEHVKNYRPQILVLSGNPGSRPPLVDLGNALTKNTSLLSCANVVKGPISQGTRTALTLQAYNWLEKHKIKSFYSIAEATDLEEGAKYLFQLVGLGKLRPNMVLLGYKANWRECDINELRAYFNTLHEALNMYLGIAILRLQNGIDYSHVLGEESLSLSIDGNIPVIQVPPETSAAQEDPQNEGDVESEGSTPPGSPDIQSTNELKVDPQKKSKKRHSVSNLYQGPGGSPLPKNVLHDISLFRRKQKDRTIDVWWLYDDGGLTLLLPYILKTRSQWSTCKLRVFTLANRKHELDMEQRSMANLLAKFRIDFSDMIVIPDMAQKAKDSSREDFEKLISDFKTDKKESEVQGLKISEAELLGQKEKTNRHLRLKELLQENSKSSSLIVMTLPMPRKNSVSAPLYMAWLETLTSGMPPFLLIRGNQTSVLTFYS